MNKTMNTNKKDTKIPQVKHFYDSQAAKKVKKLAKQALSTNLVKHSRSKTSAKKGSTALFTRVTDSPIAVQLSALAVVAAGSYLLWKNRSTIQEFIKDSGDSLISELGSSMKSGDTVADLAH